MCGVDQLNHDLAAWCARQGILGIEFAAGLDYAYEIKSRKVVYAIVEKASDDFVEKDFAQFLHEYGCEHEVGIGILSLLHEIGHHMTYHYLSEKELNDSKWDKMCLEFVDVYYEKEHYAQNMMYWHTPVEFVANIWAIDFVNQHIEAVRELQDILMAGFQEIYGSDEINDFIDELNEIATSIIEEEDE